MNETVGTIANPDPPTTEDIVDYRKAVELYKVQVRRFRARLTIGCIPLIVCWTYFFASAPTHGTGARHLICSFASLRQ
jgi:uncharacterized membrane protein YdjX (TVP38/TMEM64 family)